MSEVEYVPVHVEWSEGEPLGVDGRVVAVLRRGNGKRRTTVLVEREVADGGGDVTSTSEGVETVTLEEERVVNLDELDYRELQERAKEHDIKANQSAEDLRTAIREATE